MKFDERMGIFLRNRSLTLEGIHSEALKAENDHPSSIQLGKSFAGIPIVVNTDMPKNEIWLVTYEGEVTRFTVTPGCELCGAEPCEARNEDDGTDIWCDACYAEQRPEEVYQ